MKHRHSGKYRSKTPKGRTTLKRRPLHKKVKRRKKFRKAKKKGLFGMRDDEGVGTFMIDKLVRERDDILEKLPNIEGESLRGFMEQDLERINEEIEVWKVRAEHLN